MNSPTEFQTGKKEKKHSSSQKQSHPKKTFENLSIDELRSFWQKISPKAKKVTPEQLVSMIRRLSSDEFMRLKNPKREENKSLVQRFYTYRKDEYPNPQDPKYSEALQDFDRLMMLYLCRYTEKSLEKKGLEQSDKDNLNKTMLAEINKIHRDFPSANSFQALAEIRCNHISPLKAWELFCTDAGRKYLASNYLYIYIPYLETIYRLDQTDLKDAKTGIERVREVFDKLKKANPIGLNSHLYCKIFELFTREIKSKNDPHLIASLANEAQKIYSEIPMKKEFRTSQVHSKVLALLSAANYGANKILQFFNETLKELAEFKQDTHAAHYNLMLKFCYDNKLFASASRLLLEAWNKLILPYPPECLDNIYQINLHTKGTMGGGTHFYNGLPKTLLPLYIHALFSYVINDVMKQNKEGEICMRFIPGKPNPELKDDPDYTPNIETVKEILNCYGLKATVEEGNAGCLIVKASSKELLNPTFKKYYYDGQLRDAADVPASLELAAQGKQALPAYSPFWDGQGGVAPKITPDDKKQEVTLDNKGPC